MLKCIICRDSKLQKYKKLSGFQLLKCNSCGALFTLTTQHLRDKYINSKYTKKYTEDYLGFLPKLKLRYERQFSLIKEYKDSGKLLDIGCGTGHYLQYIKSRYSTWKVYGVEPNSLLRKTASRNVGINIRNGTLASIPYPNNYFDVVTCYDVMEHSEEIYKNLKEIKRVLKPNGIVLAQSPNYRSLMSKITGDRWDWWCIPDHVIHFTHSSLIKAFKEKKFSILHAFTYEDPEDFISNIKGAYSSNIFSKILIRILLPVLQLFEHISWKLNKGGLIVVIAQKI